MRIFDTSFFFAIFVLLTVLSVQGRELDYVTTYTPASSGYAQVSNSQKGDLKTAVQIFVR